MVKKSAVQFAPPPPEQKGLNKFFDVRSRFMKEKKKINREKKSENSCPYQSTNWMETDCSADHLCQFPKKRQDEAVLELTMVTS